MNIEILAKRQVSYPLPNGEQGSDCQVETYDAVVQTRTADTYAILATENPLEAYRSLIKEMGKNSKSLEPVYADHDLFHEEEPIGYEEYDFSVGHLEGLDYWVKDHQDKGFKIILEQI